MENRKFKPQIDKFFFFIWIPVLTAMLIGTVISWFAPVALIIMLATDVFVLYFLVSSLVGCVELREGSLFVKFGFILKKEIPYQSIRGISKARGIYTESMLSIKNAMEHVNIKYGKFDVISVSVATNDQFIEELEARLAISHRQ